MLACGRRADRGLARRDLCSAGPPQTRFASVGDSDVAYQVLGQGPPNLVLFQGIASHVELNWQLPEYAELYLRLASFCRLLIFDRRGCGVSDPAPNNAGWEELADDILAVLDAAGSETAAILAVGETVPIATLFTAMHPDRVSALILFNGFARMVRAEDYPIGPSPEEQAQVIDGLRSLWGTPELVGLSNPSRSADETFLELGASINRASATPRSVVEYLRRTIALDVRNVLPLIRVPTLVFHAEQNPFVPFELGKYLADNIEAAAFVELSGEDISLVGRHVDSVVDQIGEFLTGHRPVDVGRVLATVRFSDIVDSTATAASLGDRRWRFLLDRHDKAVRKQLRRFHGREIKTTGDGFVASFDGPARAIRCGQAIIAAARSLGIELRVGIHTGECEVRGDDLGGLAVHIAARVGSLASSSEVLVSSTVKGLVVGSDIEFEDRGEHELKGVPGTWSLFAVIDLSPLS